MAGKSNLLKAISLAIDITVQRLDIHDFNKNTTIETLKYNPPTISVSLTISKQRRRPLFWWFSKLLELFNKIEFHYEVAFLRGWVFLVWEMKKKIVRCSYEVDNTMKAMEDHPKWFTTLHF